MNRFAVFFTVLFSLAAFARGGSTMVHPLASNHIFPIPAPILFPAFTTAAGTNPAALGLSGKVAAVQGAFTPGQGGSGQEIYGGFAASSQKMGVGLGYLGDKVGGTMVNNVFAGAGFKIDPIAVGIGLRQFDTSSKINPGVDLGLIAGEGGSGGGGGGSGLRFGFVAYNLNSSAQLDAGVGFSGGKKYNMEVNILLPPFNNQNAGYTFTLAGTVYAADVVGLTFNSSYNSSSKGYIHTVGVNAWIWEPVSVFVQFSTPRAWTSGLMVTF